MGVTVSVSLVLLSGVVNQTCYILTPVREFRKLFSVFFSHVNLSSCRSRNCLGGTGTCFTSESRTSTTSLQWQLEAHQKILLQQFCFTCQELHVDVVSILSVVPNVKNGV
jgi:hypothetical protein